MEVKSSSGMLTDDARGEMAVRGCFLAPWGGRLATVPSSRQRSASCSEPSAGRPEGWERKLPTLASGSHHQEYRIPCPVRRS